MSYYVSVNEAENYDLVGTIALWQKETSKGDAFLGGVIQLGGRDGVKLNLSAFPNTTGKAALKGNISAKVGDKYLKQAWVSIFKSDKGDEAYYGYVNPNTKEDGTENLSFSFKLYRNEAYVEGETKPLFKGEVLFLKKEDKREVPVVATEVSNMF